MLKKKDEYKLKDYFEYNKKNSISITRIVSLVLIGVIAINIFSSIREIKDMQSYILGNSDSKEILSNSKEELKSIENTEDKNINIGNVRKIFEVAGVENIDSIYIDQNTTNVIGKTNDMKIIEKLMKNKLFWVQFMRIMSIYPSDPHSYYSFTEIYINLK